MACARHSGKNSLAAPCSLRFAQRLPELAQTAHTLLEWAIKPPTELGPLEEVVRQLEPVLTRAAEEAIALKTRIG